MNSANKVGEIFTIAGQAFSRLGDLTMQLQPNSESSSTGSQIRQALKKKAFEDAGIPAKQVHVQQVQHVIQPVQHTLQQIHKKQSQPQVSSIIFQQQPQQQTVNIQNLSQIVPVQTTQSHPQSVTQQILQTAPKQIIIQQAPLNNSSLPQQTQPQIVHLQPQQLQQLQAHAQQIIQQPHTTTMTLQQFQQLQQQQKALSAAAAAANAPAVPVTTSVPVVVSPTAPDTPTITEHLVIQAPHKLPIVQPNVVVSNVTTTAAVVPSTAPATTATTVTAANSTVLKSVPDVMMTLNRINTQEHEVDVEECLPADVVKLDFAGEEVVG